MLEINSKIILVAQCFLYRTEKHFVAIHAFPAFYTNQVMVVPFFRVVVNNTVAGFAFQHTSQMFKNVQVAVNSGLIHAGHLFMDMRDYFFRGQMGLSIMEKIRDQFALGSNFKSVFF
jgi:hypothetical protein